MELARLGRWLDRVAYHPLTSVDTRWLAVARVMIAGIFLVDLVTRAYLSPLVAAKPSLLSDAVGRTFATTSLPSVALGVDSVAGTQTYLACAGLAGTLFLIGFVTKPAGVKDRWNVLHDGVAHTAEECTRALRPSRLGRDG